MYCGETQFLLARYSEALADLKKSEFTELPLAAHALVHAQRGEYDEAEKAAINTCARGFG